MHEKQGALVTGANQGIGLQIAKEPARSTAVVTNYHPIRSDVMMMAERELSAFFSAVAELFGSEQAEESAEDWLRELMASNNLPASVRQWRTLTVTAAARLASRRFRQEHP